jgi:hypothetical protein
LLKDIYELAYLPGSDQKKLYRLLVQAEKDEAGNPDLQHAIREVNSAWGPLIRGNEFPDLLMQEFGKEANTLLSDFRGKAVYVSVIPFQSENSLLLMRQVLALQKKYGKKIEFVVISDVDARGKAILQEEVHLASLDFSSEQLFTLFYRLDQATFFLIDKDGKSFQVPAEGPETGIESSFLQVIQ